jgi:hypothetical protein
MKTLVLRTDGNDNWRTRYNGVVFDVMKKGIEDGKALDGWMAARSKLWELINADTILVGYHLKNDLDHLRIIHTKVVNAAILVSKAIGSSRGPPLPMLDLCVQLVGTTVPDDGRKERICLQDVMATRELVI